MIIAKTSDNNAELEIVIDAFSGTGPSYQRREECLINIADRKTGTLIFFGSPADLIGRLLPDSPFTRFKKPDLPEKGNNGFPSPMETLTGAFKPDAG